MQFVDASPLENVVILYATLRQGLSAVTNARVHARVEADNKDAETVELYDNGAGR